MVAVKKIICEAVRAHQTVAKLMNDYRFILVDMRPRVLREGLALVKAWGKLKRQLQDQRQQDGQQYA